MNEDGSYFFTWSPLGSGRQPLSAAGRMLERIEDADALAEAVPVTDELLCALKRADLKGRKS